MKRVSLFFSSILLSAFVFAAERQSTQNDYFFSSNLGHESFYFAANPSPLWRYILENHSSELKFFDDQSRYQYKLAGLKLSTVGQMDLAIEVIDNLNFRKTNNVIIKNISRTEVIKAMGNVRNYEGKMSILPFPLKLESKNSGLYKNLSTDPDTLKALEVPDRQQALLSHSQTYRSDGVWLLTQLYTSSIVIDEYGNLQITLNPSYTKRSGHFGLAVEPADDRPRHLLVDIRRDIQTGQWSKLTKLIQQVPELAYIRFALVNGPFGFQVACSRLLKSKLN